MNETSSATFETSKSALEDLLSIYIVGIEKFIEHDGYTESIPTELPCHYRFSIVLRDYATNRPISFFYYPENMEESLKELRTLTLIRQKSQNSRYCPVCKLYATLQVRQTLMVSTTFPNARDGSVIINPGSTSLPGMGSTKMGNEVIAIRWPQTVICSMTKCEPQKTLTCRF